MKKAFDKNGKEIHEFDVLKVFHYTGARNKKNYMYKWVRKHPTNPNYLVAYHLESDSLNEGYYNLQGEYEGTEIIQSPWETKQWLEKHCGKVENL